MPPLEYFLVLSAILFCTGVWGVLKSRNAIVIFMAIELMLNAVNLTLVAFAANIKLVISRFLQSIPADQVAQTIKTASAAGQVYVILVMTVAAAEAAIGLAIIISIHRMKESINVDDVNIMKW
jgi:NADH:ubiquinone oxidoreductase subunit K